MNRNARSSIDGRIVRSPVPPARPALSRFNPAQPGAGGTYEDTEGLINLPLTVKEIAAVVFFKEHGPDVWRVSMRSKYDVDVRRVASEFGGGGHKNASGFTVSGPLSAVRDRIESTWGATVVDHWGMHGNSEKAGTVELTAGEHAMDVCAVRPLPVAVSPTRRVACHLYS